MATVFFKCPHRQWSVSARAAENLRTAATDAHDRIIAGTRNRPVVQNENIGDVLQALASLLVLDGDWLISPISARGNYREGVLRHQQVMDRRIWEHRAQVG